MGKKSKRNKKKKEIIPYTLEERKKQIMQLRLKLESIGLGVYNEEMENLYKNMDEFVNNGTIYRDTIKLYGSKRKMVVSFINNNKIPVTINLLYDPNI